jgi:hypothetical protein
MHCFLPYIWGICTVQIVWRFTLFCIFRQDAYCMYIISFGVLCDDAQFHYTYLLKVCSFTSCVPKGAKINSKINFLQQLALPTKIFSSCSGDMQNDLSIGTFWQNCGFSRNNCSALSRVSLINSNPLSWIPVKLQFSCQPYHNPLMLQHILLIYYKRQIFPAWVSSFSLQLLYFTRPSLRNNLHNTFFRTCAVSNYSRGYKNAPLPVKFAILFVSGKSISKNCSLFFKKIKVFLYTCIIS